MKKRLRKKLGRREFSIYRIDENGKVVYLTTAERLRTEAMLRRIDKLPHPNFKSNEKANP